MSPEGLRRWREAYKRLLTLLDAEDRNAMVQAEILHAAAHLAEHSSRLDEHLAERPPPPHPEVVPLLDVS